MVIDVNRIYCDDRFTVYTNSKSSGASQDFPVAQMIKNDPCVGKILWRREWQPTPVFLAEEFHGQRILVGYSLWGRKELDTTEGLHLLQYMLM